MSVKSAGGRAPRGRALHSSARPILSMLRIVALLSIAARCAAFGSTFSTSSGGACIDEPAHLIAEETAKLGGEFAQYTSCDGIAAAGGCGVAIVKVVCCATCADVRAPRTGQSLDMDEILEAMFPELGGGGFRCYTRPWLCSTQGSVTQG